MARDTRKHLPSTRTPRCVVAAIVGACLVLCLALIPAATARTDRAASARAQPAPVQSPAQAPAAPSQGAGAEACCSTTQAPSTAEAPRAKAPKADPKHGAGSAGARHGGADAGSQPGSQAGTPGSSGHRQHAAKQGSGNQQTSAAEQGPAGQKGAAGKGPGRQSPGRQEGSGRRKEGTKERSHGRGGKGKGVSPQPPASSGETSAKPTVDGASLAATASPSATGAIATSEATPAAVTGLSSPTTSRRSHHVAAGASQARGSGAPARAGVAAAAAVLAPLAPAAGARPASGGHAAGGAPVAHRVAKPHGASPITTITKFVDVVPTPIRLLIVGLLALALALAVRAGMVALRARRLERQRTQLLEDVGLLQAALLPTPPARLGPVGTSVAYQPAAGPGAGGDFYDVFALEDGQLAVIVGDVSGHGRQALPHTALLRFTLRAYLETGMSPRDAVQTAGVVLERQLGGQFATVVAAKYDPRERVLVYSCAGHPPPVVLGSDADAISPVTVSSSPPIGVGMRTGTRQTIVSVPGRAQICFYTDGVTEARIDSELFGSERLLDTIAAVGAAATAATILDSVAEQADARPDDMAACLLRVEGEDGAPRVLVEELELDREEIASERTEDFLLACGLEHHEVAEVIGSARSAAGRAGTVVLELSQGDGPPEVTLQREHLAYLNVRRANMEVLR
jgi:hypothetical protein